jgi:hypothetical protein
MRSVCRFGPTFSRCSVGGMRDIATSIRRRLAELESERVRLELALVALEDLPEIDVDDPLPVARRRRRRAKSEAVPLARTLEAIAENPGASTTELIKRIGGDRNQLLALLKEAEADGELRREGTRAATRWLPAVPAAEPADAGGAESTAEDR